VLVLQGCISQATQWEHPTIISEEWGVDGAQCKWEARKKAEKEYQNSATLSGQDEFDDANSVSAMLAQAGVEKRARSLFDRCMEQLGYIAAK